MHLTVADIPAVATVEEVNKVSRAAIISDSENADGEGAAGMTGEVSKVPVSEPSEIKVPVSDLIEVQVPISEPSASATAAATVL